MALSGRDAHSGNDGGHSLILQAVWTQWWGRRPESPYFGGRPGIGCGDSSGYEHGPARGEADRLLARGYLLTILLLLLHGHLGAGHRLSGHSAATGRHRRALMLRARQYLDDHYAEEISLERLAETLKISPFYLSHLFSQEADFTFMEYLTHRRMGEARRLLEAGGHNVSETACAVGYRDANYFAKVFRRHFGLAPHEIRGPARPVQ